MELLFVCGYRPALQRDLAARIQVPKDLTCCRFQMVKQSAVFAATAPPHHLIYVVLPAVAKEGCHSITLMCPACFHRTGNRKLDDMRLPWKFVPLNVKLICTPLCFGCMDIFGGNQSDCTE